MRWRTRVTPCLKTEPREVRFPAKSSSFEEGFASLRETPTHVGRSSR
jgi:hypothetical protein